MSKKIISIILLVFTIQYTFADCVFSAKSKTGYQVIKSGYQGKILFTGGIGNDFIITADFGSYIYKNIDTISFLKDSFCSFDDTVLIIDGEVIGVSSVDTF